MKTLTSVAAAVLTFFTSHQAMAWGDEGHEVVALIAMHYLKPEVLTQINALLAADQDSLTAPDFASRATWADKYREATGFHGTNWRATHNWHFVNLEVSGPDAQAECPFSSTALSTPASQGPENDCVADKVVQFDGELSDPSTPQPERLLAFKFLLHFVGDIHQPLHDADNNDAGGNCEHVHLSQGHASNLHAFWDTNVVSAIDPDPQQAANVLIAEITPAAAQTWAGDLNPLDWAQESYGVATDTAYNAALLAGCSGGKATGAVPLDQDYVTAADAAARVQLEKAGVRLAALLNAAFVTPPTQDGDR